MPFKDILTSLDSPRLMLKTLVRFTLSVSLGQKMSSVSLIFFVFSSVTNHYFVIIEQK